MQQFRCIWLPVDRYSRSIPLYIHDSYRICYSFWMKGLRVRWLKISFYRPDQPFITITIRLGYSKYSIVNVFLKNKIQEIIYVAELLILTQKFEIRLWRHIEWIE